MTKIDIISGFLGAGKTTLIKKLLQEQLGNEKTVLIENEFGEIGIDSGFLKDAGIEIKEMNQGCICCSLVGDFGTSLKEVLTVYKPERILIEPSGVGKLSDVLKAVEGVMEDTDIIINSSVVVVDATRCKMYIKNFGEFYLNQIEHASTIILSRTDKMDEIKLEKCLAMIREHNESASIITTPWDQLESRVIIETMEGLKDLKTELLKEMEKEMEEEKHHKKAEHKHGENCACGGHGHHDHEGHGHEGHDHEGHDHEGHDHEGHDDHHHEHKHGENCACGGHGHHDHEGHEHHNHECHGHHDHEGHEHHNHDHHHADEVFTSWGKETPTTYSEDQIKEILTKLEDEKEFGIVLRAKGMVPTGNGPWIYFDYVPGEMEVRTGISDVIGKFCVIGSKLNEDHLDKLFSKA